MRKSGYFRLVHDLTRVYMTLNEGISNRKSSIYVAGVRLARCDTSFQDLTTTVGSPAYP